MSQSREGLAEQRWAGCQPEALFALNHTNPKGASSAGHAGQQPEVLRVLLLVLLVLPVLPALALQSQWFASHTIVSHAKGHHFDTEMGHTV